MSNDWLDNDPDIAETIETMRRLHNEERPRPDALFVRSLEQSLMSNVRASASHPTSSGTMDWLGSEGRRWRPEHNRSFGRVSRAITIAAVMLLVASGTWFAFREAPGTPNLPGTYAALSPGTPVIEASDSSPGDLPAGIAWSMPAGEGVQPGNDTATLFDGVVYRLVSQADFVGVQAVDASTGSVIWQRATNWLLGGVSSTSRAFESIAADQWHVYYFSSSSQLEALDVTTGEPVWSKPTGGDGQTLIASDGQLFAWDSTYALNVFNAETGEHQWSFDASSAENNTFSRVGPAVVDDIVIIATYPGTLTALDRQTGEIAWTHQRDFDVLNLTIGTIQGTDEVSAIILESTNLEWPRNGNHQAKNLSSIDPNDGSVNWQLDVYSSIGTNIAISDETIVQIVDNLEPEVTPIATPHSESSGPPIVTEVVGRSASTGEILWTYT
jgi:outer membrane protein assembly factor BamB